jgi:hypothetical protein
MPASLKALPRTTTSEILRQALDLVERYPELADNVGSVHDISELNNPNDLLRDLPTSRIGIIKCRYHESPVKASFAQTNALQ